MIGAGPRGSRQELEQLAEILGAPIGKAFLGKDTLPDDSPYTTMGVTIIGTAASRDMMPACDTLLLIGTSMPSSAGQSPRWGSAQRLSSRSRLKAADRPADDGGKTGHRLHHPADPLRILSRVAAVGRGPTSMPSSLWRSSAGLRSASSQSCPPTPVVKKWAEPL
jgi:Thiamine pyrophosphate enzyme, central domain